jgi:hypothetical protein
MFKIDVEIMILGYRYIEWFSLKNDYLDPALKIYGCGWENFGSVKLEKKSRFLISRTPTSPAALVHTKVK